MMRASLTRFQPWRIAVLGSLLVVATLVAAVTVGTGRDLQAVTAHVIVLTIVACATALARTSELGEAERRTWNATALVLFVAALVFIGTLAVSVQTASATWLVVLAVALLGLDVVWFVAAIRSRRPSGR